MGIAEMNDPLQKSAALIKYRGDLKKLSTYFRALQDLFYFFFLLLPKRKVLHRQVGGILL